MLTCPRVAFASQSFPTHPGDSGPLAGRRSASSVPPGASSAPVPGAEGRGVRWALASRSPALPEQHSSSLNSLERPLVPGSALFSGALHGAERDQVASHGCISCDST